MSAFRFLETVGIFGVRKTRRKKRRTRAARATARTVGRYQLLEIIGKGAVGEVWRAEDPHIGRSVAVKLLNIPQDAAGKHRAEWEQRFVREARAAGALSHPGIVTIHDVAVAQDGSPFIVMELVEGSSLDRILSEGPVDERTALVWGAQIAEALGAAHREGIVHRDIKPANVLIDTEGRARIADFGIARLSKSDLTHAGLFLGSPAFSSPEQIKGDAVDGRSDLFSLGALLYAMLTGARPFHGEDLSALAYAIAHVEPAPLKRLVPGLSPLTEAVVMKALEKSPGGRYANALEMAEDLRAVVVGRPLQHAVAPASLEETVRSDAPSVQAPRVQYRAGSGEAALFLALGMALCIAVSATALLSRPDVGLASPRVADPLGASPSEASMPQAGWTAEQATAEVDVRVEHSLSDGDLTIWSGKRRLLRARLTSEKGSSWLLRLPRGAHPIRIVVSSAERGLTLDEEFTRSLEDSQHIRLNVRVKELPRPRLDVQWTNS